MFRHTRIGIVRAQHGAALALRAVHHLEDQLAQVQAAGHQIEQVPLVVRREVQRVQRGSEVAELVQVAHVAQLHDLPHGGVVQRIGGQQAPAVALLDIRPGDELVEDVEVALALLLGRQAHLLQQVGLDGPADQVAALVEVELDELPKSAAVVVSDRLGVPEGFQDRVGLQHFVHHGAVHQLRPHRGVAHSGQVLQHDLGGLCLARATLAADQNRVVGAGGRVLLAVAVHHHLHHIPIRGVCDGVDMRRQGRSSVVGHDALGLQQTQVIVYLQNLRSV